ncbi:MAG: TMEM175 family protein [Candidatus Omnitrophica bacterium]|nr:TMEM175 family protein [Candidatus Omnitrophota bacterium]
MTILGHKVSSHRLAALVDGVFAIVMTILVLDIKVPHEPGVLMQIGIQHFLVGQFQDIMVYIITFIMIGYIWIIHHGESHVIHFTNRTHIWLTIFFLIFVALLPFSASLVNKFPGVRIAELYFATHMFIIGVISYINWVYITRNRLLIAPELTAEQIMAEKKKLAVLPIVSLGAIGVAFICPFVSSYTLLLAPITMSIIEWHWALAKSPDIE